MDQMLKPPLPPFLKQLTKLRPGSSITGYYAPALCFTAVKPPQDFYAAASVQLDCIAAGAQP